MKLFDGWKEVLNIHDVVVLLANLVLGLLLGLLLRWLRSSRERRQERRDNQAVERAEEMRTRPGLYEYLDYRLSKHPAVSGQRPKLMKRAMAGQELTIPACLIATGEKVRLNSSSPKYPEDYVKLDLKWEDSDYVKLSKRLGRTIEDLDVFTGQSIEVTSDGAVIYGGLSTYGFALATQDALEWELLTNAASYFRGPYAESDFSKLDMLLTLRQKEEGAASGNYLLSGEGRANALAISTLVVFRHNEGDYRVLFEKRSPTTAAHTKLFHVIPAGMFQPELNSPSVEWDVEHGFFKEYGEELFCREVDRRRHDAKYFYKDWGSSLAPLDANFCVRDLRRAVEEGKCILKPTGLIVNALNLRPELCCILLVKDAAWWEEQERLIRANWEYLPRGEARSRRGKALTDFHLNEIEKEFLDFFGCSPSEWVPPGLAALWLGVDAARKLL